MKIRQCDQKNFTLRVDRFREFGITILVLRNSRLNIKTPDADLLVLSFFFGDVLLMVFGDFVLTEWTVLMGVAAQEAKKRGAKTTGEIN